MSHFFIRLLDFLIGIAVVVGFLGVLVVAFAASSGAISGPAGISFGGNGAGIVVLIGGLLYLAFISGFLYLGVGIYDNTRRSAEALEFLLSEDSNVDIGTNTRKEPTF